MDYSTSLYRQSGRLGGSRGRAPAMGYTGYAARRSSHLQVTDRVCTTYFLYFPSVVHRSALCRNRYYAEGYQERAGGNQELRTKVSSVLSFNIQFSIFKLEHYGLYIFTKLLVVPGIVTGLSLIHISEPTIPY